MVNPFGFLFWPPPFLSLSCLPSRRRQVLCLSLLLKRLQCLLQGKLAALGMDGSPWLFPGRGRVCYLLLLGGCVHPSESLAKTNKPMRGHRNPTYSDGCKSINKGRRTVGQGEDNRTQCGVCVHTRHSHTSPSAGGKGIFEEGSVVRILRSRCKGTI